MEIEYWPIDRPIPYAKNPRKIPRSAIDKVAASIEGILVSGNRSWLIGRTP